MTKVTEIDSGLTKFRTLLESYYQMKKNNVGPKPKREFFDMAPNYYVKLKSDERKKYKELRVRYMRNRVKVR